MELERELAEHLLTAELKRRGLTDGQLAQCQFFHAVNAGVPFDNWVFRCPADISAARHEMVKAFCALRWLLLEDPPASRDTDDAWKLVAKVYDEQPAMEGRARAEVLRKNQKKGGARRREAATERAREDGLTVMEYDDDRFLRIAREDETVRAKKLKSEKVRQVMRVLGISDPSAPSNKRIYEHIRKIKGFPS